MHPLETSIDESFHRPQKVERRRSSLDNSCLSSNDSFDAILSQHEKDDFSRREKRLSLGSKPEVTNTTFLASRKKNLQNKDRAGLDADLHESDHNPRRRPSSHSKTSDTKDTVNTSSYSSDEEPTNFEQSRASSKIEEDSDESSFYDDDSDCDSFCEAYGDEPPNHSYLRAELGASLMWSDTESLDNSMELQDSWRSATDGNNSSSSFRSHDLPPGKPRRTHSGDPKTSIFRSRSSSSAGPSSPRRQMPLKTFSLGASASPRSPSRTPRRNDPSAPTASPFSAGRRPRQHLVVKEEMDYMPEMGEEKVLSLDA